ncbi:MAG: hypothetical protein H6R10_589 [Rhodocyclaceae bacterium]|nr:hypothetical protein [Rhodocyclaceae bacterium]
MFSRSFYCGAFFRGYVGPVMAQAALVEGKDAIAARGRLYVDGRALIGPAGKTFEFKSAESAALWASINKQRGERERELIATIGAENVAVYRARKRGALETVAGNVIAAAGRLANGAKREALIAESFFLMEKWNGN